MNVHYGYYDPVPVTLETGTLARRWAQPLLLENAGGFTRVWTYEMHSEAFYSYSPIFVPSPTEEVVSPSILVVSTVFLAMSLAGAGLLVLYMSRKGYLDAKVVFTRRASFKGVFLAALLAALVSLNYLLSFLFSSRVVFFFNVFIEGVIILSVGIWLYGLLNEDNDKEEGSTKTENSTQDSTADSHVE